MGPSYTNIQIALTEFLIDFSTFLKHLFSDRLCRTEFFHPGEAVLKNGNFFIIQLYISLTGNILSGDDSIAMKIIQAKDNGGLVGILPLPILLFLTARIESKALSLSYLSPLTGILVFASLVRLAGIRRIARTLAGLSAKELHSELRT